ncbi:hypothetical protein [Nguyenibacter sp. L1]|nr:hypothetical protein [Nguyenibacter sp. L1]WRH89236.1 hypothetical protein QN315_06415 [Nguyenibacter sp. L1]
MARSFAAHHGATRRNASRGHDSATAPTHCGHPAMVRWTIDNS